MLMYFPSLPYCPSAFQSVTRLSSSLTGKREQEGPGEDRNAIGSLWSHFGEEK